MKPNHDHSGAESGMEKKNFIWFRLVKQLRHRRYGGKSDSKREVDDVETKTSTADKRSLKVYHVIKSH